MFFYISVVLSTIYIIYWLVRRDIWIHGETFLGPRWLPFIGNLFLFSRDQVKNFKVFGELFEKYGPVVRIWGGPCNLIFFVNDPDVIKCVLSNPNVTDHDYFTSKAVDVSKMLISLNGEDWRRHHKILLPAFNRKLLQEYVKTFAKRGRILANKLNQLADGRSVDIYRLLGLCTLDGIAETVIGLDEFGLENGDCSLLDHINDLNRITLKRIFYPWLLVDWIFHLTEDGEIFEATAEKLRAMSEGMIKQKLSAYERGIKRPGIITSTDKKINSFLDMMIDASETQGSVLSPEELRDEVSALFLAGTETTALTMSFLLILVAIHTEVQEQIQQELESIFGESRREVTAEDVNEMPVLDRVIKETLRLYPVIPASPRLIPEDIHLPSGKILPKGSSILIFPYALHRDESNFKDPNRFWPDRWLPDNTTEKLHPYAYLPFSAGPRVCIGRHYAMLQMKSTLSEILRRCKVTTRLSEKDLTENLKFGCTLQVDRSLGGLCVQVQIRD